MEAGTTVAAPIHAAIDTARYWPFALMGVGFLLITLRLLLRERITLQGSISFMTFIGTFVLAGLFPETTTMLAQAMGFTLLSNFLLCVALMALAGFVTCERSSRFPR